METSLPRKLAVTCRIFHRLTQLWVMNQYKVENASQRTNKTFMGISSSVATECNEPKTKARIYSSGVCFLLAKT